MILTSEQNLLHNWRAMAKISGGLAVGGRRPTQAIEANERRSSISLAEELIKFCERNAAGERFEGAVCSDAASRADEGTPSGERESGADGDAADPEVAELRYGEPRIESGDQDIDRLRGDSFDDGGDVIRFADPRGIEAIGTGVGVGDETRERRAKRIGVPSEESLAAPGQDNGSA